MLARKDFERLAFHLRLVYKNLDENDKRGFLICVNEIIIPTCNLSNPSFDVPRFKKAAGLL